MRFLWLAATVPLLLLAADSPHDFRVVDGRLYNVQKSTNWMRIAGWPLHQTNAAMLFRNGRLRPPEPLEPEPKPRGFAAGGGLSKGRIEWMRRQSEIVTTPLDIGLLNSTDLPEFILVRNLTTNWAGADRIVTVLVMRAGETNGLEIWDAGTAPTNRTRTTNTQAPASRKTPLP